MCVEPLMKCLLDRCYLEKEAPLTDLTLSLWCRFARLVPLCAYDFNPSLQSQFRNSWKFFYSRIVKVTKQGIAKDGSLSVDSLVTTLTASSAGSHSLEVGS